MLSLVYNGIQYAMSYVYPKTAKNTDEEINEVISRIELANETNTDKTEKKEEVLNEEGCYYKTGSITQISTDCILIDDSYTYDIIDDSTNNLKVGDKIYYLLYLRDPNAKPKVRKIICEISNSWNNENINVKNDVHTHMTSRNIVVKVTKREGRIAIVEPNNIRVDLCTVRSDFIPIVGDWLVLDCLVELNNESEDWMGEILEINGIKPLRSQLNCGVISKYNPENKVGVINKDIIFYKHLCGMGYVPCVGDKVVTESIESDQGQYKWRSLAVTPLIQAPKKPIKLTTNNIPPSILDTELLKNKYGIVIDDKLKFNLGIEEEGTLEVLIQNNASYAHLLQSGSFVPQKTPSQLSLESPVYTSINTVINPSESVTYTFKCKPQFIGTSEEQFIFNFKDFKIARVFHININTKNISQVSPKLNSASIQQKKEKFDLPDLNELIETTCIPGVRPSKPPAFIKIRNGVFKIPRYIWNAVYDIMQNKLSQTEREIAIGDRIPCLQKELSFETYKDRFHALLFLEEIGLTLYLQRYNMKSAILRRCGDYLMLKVPGLAEKRPSLMVGDKVLVSFQWNSSKENLKYEGFIHKIKSMEIFLKFNQKFHHEYSGEDCQVSFMMSNASMQRCHNAINLALNRLGPDILFPTRVVQKEPQFYLEEYENEETSIDVRLRHNESISSNNSNSSITSVSDTSNNTVKIFPRMSVADRLSSVKSVESSLFEKTMSSTRIKMNPNFEMNLANANDGEINIANATISRTPNESITQTNDELKPYIIQIKKRKLNWFNKKLNYYQKEAVKNIILGLARPLPYIIFGPPGTGKTVTICETILQILTVIPESRLLIATPSNSSANLIAERLLDSNILKPGDMVRLIAYHCLNSNIIPEELLPYCATAELAEEGTDDRFYHHKNGIKMNCTMSVLGRHRITIGTCNMLGILHNMGFPRGHFSHILVDEAGQATEPEIMIPLNFIHSDYGQVILAGDPMQLGPVVQSQLGSFFGLGVSFLSRLLQQFPYQRDPDGFETCYDPRLVTKLVMNYRSLPEILHLPNTLFYESELQPQLSSKNSEEAKLLEMLRAELPERTGSPPAIIFHGISGENYKDSESPSWYNPEEAAQIYLYLSKLYKCGLEPDDIGIITPYYKQVVQIRDLLLELNLKLPKVSSVEGFQGQERKVIIISAVRSCNNLVDEDVKHSLGFVASPTRLNVAITRARALLIIVGNPNLLGLDPYWRSLLTYCIDCGGYTGCNFSLS
ncbi:PREDICTED: probable RNA helicase armi [Trachymyrmex cornetzi]|uniref:probable RNA helicase armi n=1 Tax=Trachymyrmex cornetzi TaxID=471704 RepID=UPI00084F1B2E|nr:PREDICTED: probable RNA helicase armi [Trachymyrmex cornetzi]